MSISVQRRNVLENVAALLGDGPALVGIDGRDGAGKTEFASELAGVLSHRDVVQISIDGFHHTRERRYSMGRYSPEGYWLNSFNYERFVTDVIEPFKLGPPAMFSRIGHDLDTDEILDPSPEPVPAGAVLIVDGIFLHRDELVSHWDVSVFLDVTPEVSLARRRVRDGASPDPRDPLNVRYLEGQKIYIERCEPMSRATVVIDNSDLESPWSRPASSRAPGS